MTGTKHITGIRLGNWLIVLGITMAIVSAAQVNPASLAVAFGWTVFGTYLTVSGKGTVKFKHVDPNHQS